jgi:threonine dehydratase
LTAPDVPDFDAVIAAAGRISGHVLHTPMMRSDRFDTRVGAQVFFKCENLQIGGSFKLRGATNAIRQLDPARASVVATHSSGNHGTAIALAARARGMRSIIVMPRDSAQTKLAAVKSAGADIVLCDPGTAAREAALTQLLQRQPAAVVHPFDDERVIAGQGTAALELLVEVPGIDCVVAPVGGGGLIGGTALAAKGIGSGIRVVAAEPAMADDAFRSFKSGARQSAGVPDTIADGLRGSIGVRNFSLLRNYVDDVVTVSEAAIVAAMRTVLEDLKLLIEPSAAVAVAAVLGAQLGSGATRIGVVLSGGNVDLGRCPFLAGDQLT